MKKKIFCVLFGIFCFAFALNFNISNNDNTEMMKAAKIITNSISPFYTNDCFITVKIDMNSSSQTSTVGRVANGEFYISDNQYIRIYKKGKLYLYDINNNKYQEKGETSSIISNALTKYTSIFEFIKNNQYAFKYYHNKNDYTYEGIDSNLITKYYKSQFQLQDGWTSVKRINYSFKLNKNTIKQLVIKIIGSNDETVNITLSFNLGTNNIGYNLKNIIYAL